MSAELNREERMKLRRQEYKEANKQTLCIYNLTNTVLSIGLAAATFVILSNYPEKCEGINIRICLWLIAFMHIINAVEAVFDYTGLDNIFCCCCCVIGFFAYEVGVIIYMNTIMWNAGHCEEPAPTLYAWLLTNVIIFYFSFAAYVFFTLKSWFGSPPADGK